MIALTDEIYFLWIKTLKQLVSITLDRQVTDITPSDPDMLWIRQLWPLGTKTINREKAEALCAQIGLQIKADVGDLKEVSINLNVPMAAFNLSLGYVRHQSLP